MKLTIIDDTSKIPPLTNFEAYLEKREASIDGVSPWYWIKSDGGEGTDGGAWQGPLEDFPPLKEAVLAHRKGDGVIVQAGGCCGMYPRLWAQYFGRVYTFEPDPLNFFVLNLNCQNPNVVKFNAALGDKDGGLVDIQRLTMRNVGMHRITKGKHVPTLTIDQLQLDRCDVIQLDVEGFEYPILQGAHNTICKFKPLITVEKIHHGQSTEVEGFLTAQGYKQVATLRYDSVFST